MAIKKKEKAGLLQTAALLVRANERMFLGIRENPREAILDVLSQSQETAFYLGTELEKIGQAQIVPLLETYCEDLYTVSTALSKKKELSKLHKKIKKELHEVYERIQTEVEAEKSCLVFLPHKASEWVQMEALWKAAVEDGTCEVYVVPIPYFDKDEEGDLQTEHYEGERFPEEVPITDYRAFSLSEKQPEAIFIQTPYDFNEHMSVHPDFYSSQLEKYTERIVRVPDDLKSGEPPFVGATASGNEQKN